MSRWFRHYAGMMRDEKLVRVAVKAKQPVERVLWVWGAILESASEINDGGRYEFDPGEAAYFLRCDDAELVRIEDELSAHGRVSERMVVRWGDRQYSSDTSKERQRRYRERRAGSDVPEHENNRDSDVTPPSRDAELTCVDQFFAPAFYRLPAHLWREARDRVFARDDFTCVYCGDRGGKLECDHVVPVARGGSDADENLATACLSCNRSKRDMLVSEWRQ